MNTKRITLCGSTKFKREFEAVNRQLSLEGNIVYSVAFFGHADNVPLTPEQKEKLDLVHLGKIDNSDVIFVIDVDGYIGESTRKEIDYAEMQGKGVFYLSRYPDLKTICDYATFSTPSQGSGAIDKPAQSHSSPIIQNILSTISEEDRKEVERQMKGDIDKPDFEKMAMKLPCVKGGISISEDGLSLTDVIGIVGYEMGVRVWTDYVTPLQAENRHNISRALEIAAERDAALAELKKKDEDIDKLQKSHSP